MISLIHAYRQWSAFQALQERERRVTFYVEDRGSWTFLGPIIDDLQQTHGVPVAYLTSERDDPALDRASPTFAPFFIGEGMIRTFAFLGLKTPMLVMTMPDLETFHIKRSKAEPVHYAYVFHAMTSTHMVYREHAFDHFDTVLCVGPHHEREIRAAEALRDLPAKNLVPHGYARLDQILDDRAKAEAQGGHTPEPDTVLVAPTWGPHGLFEAHGTAPLLALLEAGLQVIARPHPMTVRQQPMFIRQIQALAAKNPRLQVDLDVNSRQSLLRSILMISDWSGAAMEYALGWGKPVIFVDVPPKVNNPHWEQIGVEPVEKGLRSRIGAVVPAGDQSALVQAVQHGLAHLSQHQDQLTSLRDEVVYHPGESAPVAARWISEFLTKPSSPTLPV